MKKGKERNIRKSPSRMGFFGPAGNGCYSRYRRRNDCFLTDGQR